MYYFITFVLFFTTLPLKHAEEEEIRIGIIGGGIGGTSAAYYLRSLFGDGCHIDLFESERVGGRLANINIDGFDYEAGGSIIHPKNEYMVQFAEKFGFKQSTSMDGKMALYGPSGILLESSSWNFISMFKFLWRYGMDIWNIESFIKENFLDKFSRIYDIQEEGLAYTTVEDLLKSMDESLLNYTKISIKDLMIEKGFSERFINELVMGALRTNYGQTPKVHAFVGAVSLAGVEKGLWSVKGGNYQIPERLLKKSGANLIKAKVTHVVLQKEGESISYEVQYQNVADGKSNSREYDIVIVATPLKKLEDHIKFEDFPNPIPSSYTDFHRTIALFVQGTPNYTAYGFENSENFPQSILTTDESIFWNSYGQHKPVSQKKHLEKNTNDDKEDNTVSKIFLNKIPTDDQVNFLFKSRKDLRLVNWLAYPEYTPKMDLPPFVLYDQLYYVNAIESAASAMEMSVIGGRNVANLAYNHWNNILDKVDEFSVKKDSTSDKSEL